MNQSEMILSELLRFEEKELIVLNALYKSVSQQHDISKSSFYKAFGRLSRANKLVRVSKGVYAKPKFTNMVSFLLMKTRLLNTLNKITRGWLSIIGCTTMKG